MTEEKRSISQVMMLDAVKVVKKYCTTHPECNGCPLHSEIQRGCTAFNVLPYEWRIKE